MINSSLRTLFRRLPVLADVARLIRRPRHELILWSDYRRTRRQTAFLRGREPTPGAKFSLHPCLVESVYDIKLQMVLATALAHRGWTPLVVARDRQSTWVKRYARAFGIHRIEYYADIELGPEAKSACRAHAQSLLRRMGGVQEVKAWTFCNSWIGPQVLSTLSRKSMQAVPDPRDPAVRADIQEVLPDVLENVLRAEKLLQQLSPELVTVVEANYATYGVVVDAAVAQEIDVIQVTQPWRDDAFMCRRLTSATRREHPSSVSRETMDQLSARPWTNAEEASLQDEFAKRYGGAWFLQSRNQPATQKLGREAILTKYELDPAKPLAVVFSHVLWDANLFYGEDLFEDYGDWFAQTVRAAATNTAVNWLVKLHPANLWKRALEEVEAELSEVSLLRNVVGFLPDHVRLLYPDARVSTLSLYESADVGVTVRGTPGMEMATFGKPVLTAGTGRYSGLGFTIDSRSREEYLQRLAQIPHIAPLSPTETLRAKQHALAVFRLRPWTAKSFRVTFRPEPRGAHPLYQNIEWQVSSLAEMLRRGDLDAWAQWAEGDSVDYLDHNEPSGAGAD